MIRNIATHVAKRDYIFSSQYNDDVCVMTITSTTTSSSFGSSFLRIRRKTFSSKIVTFLLIMWMKLCIRNSTNKNKIKKYENMF